MSARELAVVERRIEREAERAIVLYGRLEQVDSAEQWRMERAIEDVAVAICSTESATNCLP